MSEHDPSAEQGHLFTGEVSYSGTDPDQSRKTVDYDTDSGFPEPESPKISPEIPYEETPEYALGELLLTISVSNSAGALATSASRGPGEARTNLKEHAAQKGLTPAEARDQVANTSTDHVNIAEMWYERWRNLVDSDEESDDETPSLGDIRRYYYRTEEGVKNRKKFLAHHRRQKELKPKT